MPRKTCAARMLEGLVELPTFGLFHAGPPGQKQLLVNHERVWGRLSNHVYFLADKERTVREYMEREGSEERVLYVVDARDVPSGSIVVTQPIGLWYDDIRDLEWILSELKTGSHIQEILDSCGEPTTTALRKYFQKHSLQTDEDVGGRLAEAKRE